MRVLFKGPEGAYWVGKEFRVSSVESSKISALSDLQIATGWKMPELMKNAELEMVGVRMLAFLTLRNAGQYVSWDAVGDVSITDLEFIHEPGDDPDAGDGADPQGARGGSTPGDADDTPQHPEKSPSKPKSPGSGKRSGPGK